MKCYVLCQYTYWLTRESWESRQAWLPLAKHKGKPLLWAIFSLCLVTKLSGLSNVIAQPVTLETSTFESISNSCVVEVLPLLPF